MIQLSELTNAYPLLILIIGAIISLMLAVFYKKATRINMAISAVSVFLAIFLSISDKLLGDVLLFNSTLKINAYTASFSVSALITVLMSILSSGDYLKNQGIDFGEFYSLVLFSATGMFIMTSANDLLVLFVGLEIMSICFYIMSGLLRKRVKSNESAIKYFLLGAFMTGFLLLGISIMYGFSGTTNIPEIIKNSASTNQPIFIIGFVLFITGFLFKIGVFPFHMWVPDVYEGAPTVITGLMSTAGKIAAAGTLVMIAKSADIEKMKLIFSVIAVLSMFIGNVTALAQHNMKRLLAFSSIASAGYILVGIAAMSEFTLKSVSFYLMSYAFMQLGAFIIIAALESQEDGKNEFRRNTINDYKGLGKTNPGLAILLTIFLFSLGGIPPFAGFWGKYYLFYAAIQSKLIWLSIIAIVLSVVAIYYYLKIIVYMWFMENENPIEHIEPGSGVAAVTYFAGFVSILFGIYPQLYFSIFKILV